MASKPPKKPPRRPPPTIELSATEVRVEPPRDMPPAAEPDVTASAPAEPAVTPAEEPVVSAPPEPQPEPVTRVLSVGGPPPEEPVSAQSSPEETYASEGPPEPPHHEPPQDRAPPPPPPPPPPRSRWSGLSAAGGAAAIVAIVVVLWALGLIAPREQQAPRVAASPPETQAPKSATASVDPKLLDDITARIGRIEAAVASPRPAAPDASLLGRLGSIEVAVKSLGDATANINTRSEEMAAALKAARERVEATAKSLAELQALVERQRSASTDKAEVERLAQRIAALESSTRTVEKKIETPGSTAADRDVRMAVLAAALKDAVSRGAPYGAELAAIKPLVKDATLVAALDKFATTGAPTPAALGAELARLVPAMAQLAAPQARDGTLLERLQANATRLVRVRPVDAPVGDDPEIIVQRLDVKAQSGDVSGALADLAKLSPQVRAPAEPWITKARARNSAVQAAQKIAADTFGALAPPAH